MLSQLVLVESEIKAKHLLYVVLGVQYDFMRCLDIQQNHNHKNDIKNTTQDNSNNVTQQNDIELSDTWQDDTQQI